MQPTNKLRWLLPPHPAGDELPAYVRVPVLQQWWAVFREGQETPEGEWRDVPEVTG